MSTSSPSTDKPRPNGVRDKAARTARLMKARIDANVSCREWLLANGYEDIARLIDGFMKTWSSAGKKSRRDWWILLAGTAAGKPRKVQGVLLPVLKAARRRQGFPTDVEGAIERNPYELASEVVAQERWGHKGTARKRRDFKRFIGPTKKSHGD